MIKVIDRKLIVPKNEKFIGCSGDNLVEQRQFEVPAEYSDFIFKLDIQIDAHKGSIPLTKLDGTDNIWIWDIKEEQIPCSGLVHANLSAFDSQDVQKWNTISEPHFTVEKTVNADGEFAPLDPTGFRQIETHIANMKNDVIAKAAEVEADRSEVAENTQTVLDKAAETLQIAANALDSANKAKASEENSAESKASALQSMQTAVQAMQDLLAMMGTDIATLVGGKIPMSQLPATATQEIVEISNESELITAVAQRGDLAEIIEVIDGKRTVTKTYQLLGDGDPTNIENWVVWGTSYAVQAGNATTADEAVNATMINNHRQVRMTQAEYDIAHASGTLDADTDYWVAG